MPEFVAAGDPAQERPVFLPLSGVGEVNDNHQECGEAEAKQGEEPEGGARHAWIAGFDIPVLPAFNIRLALGLLGCPVRRIALAVATIDRMEEPTTPIAPRISWRWPLLAILACILVFSTRAHWLDVAACRLPYYDEISAELVPAAHRAQGEWPPWSELIRPHNEHRILWQRLLAEFLLKQNDMRWDSQLRCLANAVFTAIYAMVLALALRGSYTGRRGHALFWPAILLLATPIAYQNMVFGFQTSFHLQMLLSIAALAGLLGGNPKRPGWWVGLICGLSAIFTNGSGFFTAPILLVWLAIDLVRKRADGNGTPVPLAEKLRQSAPTIIAATLILIAGLALMHKVDGNAHMAASGVGEFLHGFAKHLAWPWQEHPWVAPLLWSPVPILAWRILRGGGDARWLVPARFALCFAGWLLLNMLAMAWVRGARAVGPVSRYEDFHLLGAIVNAGALVLVLVSWRDSKSRIASWRVWGWTATWMVPAVIGLAMLVHATVSADLPEFRAFGALQERNTAAYTAGGDKSVMDGYVPRFHLPYPDMGELKEWFDDPVVVAALPAPYSANRAPLADATTTGTCASPSLPKGIVIPPGEFWWTSSFNNGTEQHGSFTSGPILAKSSALRFWYLGMDTGGSLKLRLKPEGGKKSSVVQIFTLRRHGTSTWMPLTVPVKAGTTYRIEFSDISDNGWGAITMPVDEPPLSRLAAAVCAYGDFAAALALVLILLVAGSAGIHWGSKS